MDSSEEDIDLEQTVHQMAENVAIVREFPMEQASNLQNCDTPVDVEFGWSSVDTEPFVMPFTGESGLAEHLPDSPVALDFFNLMFNDEMWGVLIQQTNLYATQTLATTQLKPQSRMQKWSPVTVDEMKVWHMILYDRCSFFIYVIVNRNIRPTTSTSLCL